MAEIIKSCDYTGDIAAKVFEMLNPERVRLKESTTPAVGRYIIISDLEPNQLIYPEGWYFAKGYFRNKHQSTTGHYDEIIMMTPNNEFWGDIVNYSTLE